MADIFTRKPIRSIRQQKIEPNFFTLSQNVVGMTGSTLSLPVEVDSVYAVSILIKPNTSNSQEDSFILSLHNTIDEAEFVAEKLNNAVIRKIQIGIPDVQSTKGLWSVMFNSMTEEVLNILLIKESVPLNTSLPEAQYFQPDATFIVHVFANNSREAKNNAKKIFMKFKQGTLTDVIEYSFKKSGDENLSEDRAYDLE